MARTDDIDKQDRERRRAQSGKLPDWATKLKLLADKLWDEDRKNGWRVRYLDEPHARAVRQPARRF